MSLAKKVKKKKKNITLGLVHIKATFNNTIVTISDVQGNVIAISTAGSHGFKGAKKATPYAAQITVDKVAEEAKSHGMKTVSIRVKGAGSQRESAMRAIFSQNFVVTSITDVSGVAHNGVRAPKRRRV
ncbi:MAG TPA: 30S ribosomal protein S11 [Candidatus Megaira endosymbiont of Nemacystus decipiens]|nr:30S ribosomal protein S11 [Candidatus Megaera endosymbiont of Nemacystus decipiens]